LEEWIGDDDRLVPLWSALPTDDSLCQLQALYRDGRVRGVRLARAHGLPLSDWTHGELLQWLSDVDVPLWVALPEVDARDLVNTMRGYPHLRLVLAGAHYSDTLLAGKLMNALPNTFLELSRFETLDAINNFIERFGASRLLYGSWYPRYAMGPVLYFIHHCGLSRETLAQICAGNLVQLLSRPGEQR
jgi:predicted TIM-barrel fold metal-dependent hydrolase